MFLEDDDEFEQLDQELADALHRVTELEMLLDGAQREWEETYPYEALELAREAIELLTEKALAADPMDLEVKDMYQRSLGAITDKLKEPDIFYLR